jgi:hypothetical protein
MAARAARSDAAAAAVLAVSSVRPRRGELLEDGYVIDTGRVREHRGSQWVVWMPTDLAMDWYLRAEQQAEAA